MKILRAINDKFEEVVSVICLVAMVVIVFLQVLCRYVLHAALPWSEEIARFLFLWIIWLGAAYATKENKHIKLDVVVSRLKGKVKTVVTGIAFIVWLVFMIILSILSFQLTANIFSIGQISTAARIPMWIPYASVTVGAVLCVFRMIQNAVLERMRAKRGE